jgi:ATP-binding cassette subfamily B protein
MAYFEKLRQLLDRKTKAHLLWLVGFSVFVSVIETVGISAIMPFIDVATNFESIQTNKYYKWLFDLFSFESEVNFAMAFGIVLLGFYIFRGGINILYNYLLISFSKNLAASISKKLFKIYLAMPYQLFVNKNSSFLTKAILGEAGIISSVVNAVLFMVSEIFVIVFLYTLMLFASWKITLVFTGVLLLKLIFLTQTISKKIKAAGVIRETFTAKFYEVLNKTFGNFKHIKLQKKERLDELKVDFNDVVNESSRIGIIHETLAVVPRLFLETIGFGMVVLLLVFLLYQKQSNVLYILPILSLFVLSLYRLLPSVNRLVTGYNTVLFYHKSIDVVRNELQTTQESLSNEVVVFNKKIVLENVDFAYQEKNILNDISLTINRGEKVAFVGESGSGKSTLVDLIIGLYQQKKGEIKVDNILLDKTNLQNWRSQIGYIPQQVYLFDGTVADNICFGRKVDNTLLEKVLKQANIFDFLQTKEGFKTLVGEGGIQLSGGQKQRIAIARALYGQPEILVLDEATSALDNETEQKIMSEIYKISEGKTLIIIAHRLSTIKGCDKVYEIKNGVINVQ